MSHCSDAPSFPSDGDGVIAREVEYCDRGSSDRCFLCYKRDKTMDELNSPSRHPPSINKLFLWSYLLIIAVIPMSPSTGDARVTTNMTSSGLNTQVTHVGVESTITGGTSPVADPTSFTTLEISLWAQGILRIFSTTQAFSLRTCATMEQGRCFPSNTPHHQMAPESLRRPLTMRRTGMVPPNKAGDEFDTCKNALIIRSVISPTMPPSGSCRRTDRSHSVDN